jgi:hypothetical protein
LERHEAALRRRAWGANAEAAALARGRARRATSKCVIVFLFERVKLQKVE